MAAGTPAAPCRAGAAAPSPPGRPGAAAARASTGSTHWRSSTRMTSGWRRAVPSAQAASVASSRRWATSGAAGTGGYCSGTGRSSNGATSGTACRGSTPAASSVRCNAATRSPASSAAPREELLQELCHRVERGVGEVGRPARLEPGVGFRPEVLAELARETRLPDPRLAHQQHHLSLPLAGVLPALAQRPAFALPPDERRQARRRAPRRRTSRAPHSRRRRGRR